MNELKKCPFCGSELVIKQSNGRANYYVNYETVFSVEHELMCPTCGINFGFNISEYKLDEHGQIKTAEDGYKELVDRWNKRVEEPQERKESNIEWMLNGIKKGNFNFDVCRLAHRAKWGMPCVGDCDECEFKDNGYAVDYLLEQFED